LELPNALNLFLFTIERKKKRKMKRLIIAAIAVMTLLAACQSGGSQPTNPAAVMDAYTAAINAHDLEKALSYVADDAVYDRPAGAFNGKEEVRGFIEDLFARNVQVELIGERTVDGERVTWKSRVMIDDPENPGVRLEIINNSESIVRDGKIVKHTARREQ
jgi:predicted SnoaL-like aldol condensation-catalyzing enzyme